MKKILSMFLIAMLMISGLAACSEQKDEQSQDSSKKSAEERKMENEEENKETSEEEQAQKEESGKTEVQNEDEKAQVRMVNSDEAKALIKDGAILVDVRTEGEYEERHIEGSLLIPLDELESTVSEKIQDKESKVIVYCRSGRRSGIAAEMLIDMGYTKVFDLGSINNWEE